MENGFNNNAFTQSKYGKVTNSIIFLVKATNPLVDQPDPLDVASFCERVTHEPDGPQVAVKLLAYRIHSPQEKEALNALAV